MIKHYLAISALLLAPLSAHATVYLSGSTTSGITSTTAYTTGQAAGAAFGSANIGTYSSAGLGVNSTADLNASGVLAAPDHGFDNDGRGGTGTTSGVNYDQDFGPDGAVDAALFQFNAGVSLNSLTVGYVSGDADITVLAYIGSPSNVALPTNANVSGESFADLLSRGWAFIGSYNMALNTAKTINTGNVYSSYWLISAYTSVAGTGGDNSSLLDFGNDYFKLSGISGTACATTTNGGVCGGGGGAGSVPEPTSLLLLASGMLGWRMNRKNKALAA
ncbi:hypothetical protein [Methylomonas albis]|uniref:PEP-CTERM sorting domain-containing protein n=1 Tax=Methylomonas albis TaxID=1854563 RepID=A0ABR9D0W0_9GAMM|nr:exosortase-dependent surface protein XDP1 [Methylomonas albis]MBD9355567.1 PEP-CTERM sorting domain-containing protein [Methylomonas albis]CAD6878573.1 hypothetical protein [Methylomonas albis]